MCSFLKQAAVRAIRVSTERNASFRCASSAIRSASEIFSSRRACETSRCLDVRGKREAGVVVVLVVVVVGVLRVEEEGSVDVVGVEEEEGDGSSLRLLESLRAFLCLACFGVTLGLSC